MKVFLKAGGRLQTLLKPDIDQYTRQVEIDGPKTIGEILKSISVDQSFVAFIYVDGKIRDFSYVPSDGQSITLQPPVSGG
jgi:molybdopterin converting factor small subunit